MMIQLMQETVQAGENAGGAAPSTLPLGARTLAPLRRALKTAARFLDLPARCEVSVLITGDRRMRDLNRRYRNLDKPTDVLSFSQEDSALLGDVVISAHTASRQAAGAGWPLASELALLGVHGLLHLAGFDDTTDKSAQQMEQATRQILVQAGIPLPKEDHPFFQNKTV